MSVVADARSSQAPKTVGFVQTWESLNSYPEETLYFSDVSWSRHPKSGDWPSWLRGIALSEITPIIGDWAQNFPADTGRQWIPWSFSIVPADFDSVTAYSPGLRSISSTVLSSPAAALAVGGTPILPAASALSLMGSYQVGPATYTSLPEEIHKIRLLTPGILPRTLRLSETFWEDSGSSLSDPKLTGALIALHDLERWLNRSPDELADICRISLRAIRYWNSGKTKSPRSETLRRLDDVHGFIGSLVRTMGRQGARDWLDQVSGTSASRLHVLSEEDGLATLTREASPWLFADSPRPEAPRSNLAEAVASDTAADPYEPSAFRGPIRRPRKAPRPEG